MAEHNNITIIKAYAPWCKPCRVYAHAFHRVTTEAGFPVEEINIDNEPERASAFDVSVIPTTIIMKDDKIVGRKTGAMIERDLRTFIQQSLQGANV